MAGGLTLRCVLHFRTAADCTVTMNRELFLQLWYCSLFSQRDYSATHWIQSFSFPLSFLLFHLSLPMYICECICVPVKMLNKRLARVADRKNVLNPLTYEYTTHPLTLLYMQPGWTTVLYVGLRRSSLIKPQLFSAFMQLQLSLYS